MLLYSIFVKIYYMKILNSWEKLTGVYCIKNCINDKCYVGSSINIRNRILKHRSLLRNNKHENQYLQNSWNKNKEHYFIAFVLETCSEENIIETEQKWINDFGDYNLIKKVERKTMTLESRKKMSETRLKKINSGEIIKNGTKKIKQYDIQGNFIKEHSSITEASKECKISKCQIRKVLQEKHKTGKGFQWKYSTDDRIIKNVSNIKQEANIKISFKLKRKVKVQDFVKKETMVFNSYKECAAFFNVKYQTISHSIKKSKTLYKKRYLITDLIKQDELLETPND